MGQEADYFNSRDDFEESQIENESVWNTFCVFTEKKRVLEEKEIKSQLSGFLRLILLLLSDAF